MFMFCLEEHKTSKFDRATNRLLVKAA